MDLENSFVCFTCQRCLQFIRLDEGFNYLNEHVLAEFTLPIYSNTEADLESHVASLDHLVHPCRLSDSGNGVNGFMFISDTENHILSTRMKVHAALFDTISGNSNIDHPLCDECADALLEMLDQKLKMTQNDYDDYCAYLKKLESETQDQPELDELETKLEELQKKEQELLEELKVLQDEEEVTQQKINEKELEGKQLAAQEEEYYRENTRYWRELLLREDEYKSLECQLTYAQSQLEKLKKTNVFNATFHIWYSGHFGTINNFRLGRLPASPVERSEINAAWGQTALLLSALARKINLTFDKYKLVPYGNHSYIEVLGELNKTELPLFSYGGIRFFWDTKQDPGMVAFLECLQQFQEKVEQVDKEFRLPYRINKTKIEDPSTNNSYSIKIQFNSEEQWTKALKFMLTNLKWSLTWVSQQLNAAENQLDS